MKGLALQIGLFFPVSWVQIPAPNNKMLENKSLWPVMKDVVCDLGTPVLRILLVLDKDLILKAFPVKAIISNQFV